MPLDFSGNIGPNQHLYSGHGSGRSSSVRPMLCRLTLPLRQHLCFPCAFDSSACLVTLKTGLRRAAELSPFPFLEVSPDWDLSGPVPLFVV